MKICKLLFLLLLTINLTARARQTDRPAEARKQVDLFVKNYADSTYKYLKTDTVFAENDGLTLRIVLNKNWGHFAWRPDRLRNFETDFSTFLKARTGYKKFTFYCLNVPLARLIPRYFREENTDIPVRYKVPHNLQALVHRLGREKHDKGLENRYIALWHSHGWYYENKLDRWEWQRARSWRTVEDLFPASFVLPYLVPMLENAGANVLLPRERDLQTEQVIVDNDDQKSGLSFRQSGRWQTGEKPAWGRGPVPLPDRLNLFRTGSFLQTKSRPKSRAEIIYSPKIPERGTYAVYVSYASLAHSSDRAIYEVRHAGGMTQFAVNQQIGGGTWIYLGSFLFEKGQNPAGASVRLFGSGEKGKVVTADAVRFGGGTGEIARNGKTSGMPKFAEAARYYLQFAGAPDTLTYYLNDGKSDYKDDYQSRGEWVNWLVGAPAGPTKNRLAPGLGIPVDLSFAFHTDAGLTKNDRTIGTLMIYNSAPDSARFPDGTSRFASRDLADICQNQLINDIRQSYDSAWNRRPIWDRGYSEAYRPNVPAALLELLSHQNFADMRRAADPRFRFLVGRAIYKSFLRFLAARYGTDYVVQPLPVTHFGTEILKNGNFRLRWKAQIDSLESTAGAEKFMVYRREETGGFDNGTLCKKAEFVFENPEPGKLYSFKITALNAGGESFPSEILAISKSTKKESNVLIINQFDRLSGPAEMDEPGRKGFDEEADRGVQFGQEFGVVGRQYDFNPDSPWLDDDAPGFGASHADREGTVSAGNTFDYSARHAAALRDLGFSVSSVSDEYFEENASDLSKFTFLDLLAGEEKETKHPVLPRSDFKIFGKKMQAILRKYAGSGGKILASGSYLGTDCADSTERQFLQDVLGVKLRTGRAVRSSGKLRPADERLKDLAGAEFPVLPNPEIYEVEAPDALEPADSLGKTVLRYAEGNKSAGVFRAGKHKTAVFGFPIETLPPADLENLFRAAVLFFESDN